jgi:WD40 repeat protein
MAYSPDGLTLVTGGNDGTLKFWDAAAGMLKLAFKAHGGAIKHVSFSRDGRLMLTSGSDRRPKIFDAATGQEKLALRKHRSDVDGAAFAPDSRMFATIFSNNKEGGEVHFWQTATGQEVGILRVAGTQVIALDWSADGESLVLGCRDGSVRLCQLTSGPAGDRVTAQERHILRRHVGEVRSVAFSTRGGLAASAGVDGTARLWRVADGQELHVLTAHAREVRSVAFSQDGRFLVTAGSDSAARLWQVENGGEILTVKVRKGAILRALLSPDGKTLVTAGADRAVRFWDLEQERRAGLNGLRELTVALR